MDIFSQVRKNRKIVSKSKKAGLKFPVGRITRYLRKGRYADRIGMGAPVFLTAVLEYLVAEILELAGNAATDNNKKRISARHIQVAIQNDNELTELLSDVTITSGGLITKDNYSRKRNQKKNSSKLSYNNENLNDR